MVDAIARFVGALIGVWIFWMLWCYVVPQIWIGGPPAALNPSFWMFFCAFWMLRFIRNLVFGPRS